MVGVGYDFEVLCCLCPTRTARSSSFTMLMGTTRRSVRMQKAEPLIHESSTPIAWACRMNLPASHSPNRDIVPCHAMVPCTPRRCVAGWGRHTCDDLAGDDLC